MNHIFAFFTPVQFPSQKAEKYLKDIRANAMGRCQRGVHFGDVTLAGKGEESSKFPIGNFFSHYF